MRYPGQTEYEQLVMIFVVVALRAPQKGQAMCSHGWSVAPREGSFSGTVVEQARRWHTLPLECPALTFARYAGAGAHHAPVMLKIQPHVFRLSSLRAAHLALFVLSTVTAVALLATAWKFGIEELADPWLPGVHQDEPDAERWEFVFLSAAFSAIALALPCRAVIQLLRENLAVARLSRDVFTLAPQPMVVTTASGQILAVNHAWEVFSGRPSMQCVGLQITGMGVTHLDTSTLRRVVESVNHAGIWAGEVQGSVAGSEPNWAWLAVTGITDSEQGEQHQVWSFSDITVQKRREAFAEHAAFHDPLTGLPNRRLLHQRLTRLLDFYRQAGGGLALLFIDLDGFKPVNDVHGHDIGDKVLREAAERLRNCARGADTVARVGGDEFVILAGGASVPEDAEAIARRCLEAFEQDVLVGQGATVRIGASVGIALAGPGLDEPDAIIIAADEAMYKAKRAGGRRWALAEPGG